MGSAARCKTDRAFEKVFRSLIFFASFFSDFEGFADCKSASDLVVGLSVSFGGCLRIFEFDGPQGVAVGGFGFGFKIGLCSNWLSAGRLVCTNKICLSRACS